LTRTRMHLQIARHRPRLRATLITLCTSAPPLPRPDLTVGRLRELLETSDAPHLDGALEEKLFAAWDAGWREQSIEIEALGRDLTGTPETEDNALNLRELLEASENKTAASAAERDLAARAVSRKLFRFWRYSAPRADQLDQKKLDEWQVDREKLDEWQGRNVTREAALRERRRQLMRHAAAGTVEYRIFGDVLARDDALLDALPAARTVTFDGAWRQLGGLANLTGWAQTVEELEDAEEDEMVAFENSLPEGLQKMLEEQEEQATEEIRQQIRELDPTSETEDLDPEELGERLIDLQAESGTIWWRQWWVPAGVNAWIDGFYYGQKALSEGIEEPSAAGAWLRLLANTLRRSGSANGIIGDDSLKPETNAFPLLLLLLCVARQGHIEAAAVYAISRALGTLNAEAISEREGFGQSTSLDVKVSETEATNTLLPIAVEALKLVEKDFLPYAFGLTFVATTISVGFPLLFLGLLWYLTSAGLGSFFDFLLNYGKPDPLDF